jgi:hypothetical protein
MEPGNLQTKIMLFLPPHNEVSLTSPLTLHFHLLFCYTLYLSLSLERVETAFLLAPVLMLHDTYTDNCSYSADICSLCSGFTGIMSRPMRVSKWQKARTFPLFSAPSERAALPFGSGSEPVWLYP